MRECEKLRRERRELFERKASNFHEAVASLSRNKSIRIKVDAHLEKLATKSTETVQFVLEALANFQKESSALCGKAYEYPYFHAVTSQQLKGALWS